MGNNAILVGRNSASCRYDVYHRDDMGVCA